MRASSTDAVGRLGIVTHGIKIIGVRLRRVRAPVSTHCTRACLTDRLTFSSIEERARIALASAMIEVVCREVALDSSSTVTRTRVVGGRD